jgi:ubiquinone/menaquinone biosynthesis C-methylase UbiE
MMDKALQEKIHEANIAVHRFEAKYYELLHPEVYSQHEQRRIRSTLRLIDNLIVNDERKALDFGSGTGNLTSKLLQMGYNVTATDISAEMCAILKDKYATWIKTGKLTVINSPVEDVNFDKDEFDLITCYSVLHHLPSYVDVIQRLSFFLKEDGIMYVDHEVSPFYWRDEANFTSKLVKDLYLHSNPLLNAFYFQIIGVKFPSLDYTLSDYWHKKEHSLDHKKVESVFKENFDFFTRRDYYLKGTWVFNPLFYVYKRICKPEMSFWIAKK